LQLTDLLSDALGGNARTVLILTVANDNYALTKSTLDFGNRAKTVILSGLVC
jgi:hypothetical protein